VRSNDRPPDALTAILRDGAVNAQSPRVRRWCRQLLREELVGTAERQGLPSEPKRKRPAACIDSDGRPGNCCGSQSTE
jgi:hypothetical protein